MTATADTTITLPATEGVAVLYESSHLRLSTADGVATLTASGVPPDLATAVRIVRDTPAVEVVVVRSSDDASRTDDAQRLLTELTELPVPTVAVLADRPCRGPELELALACDYRFAVAGPNAVVGFPDGCLHWGGATRLTRLVGPRAAGELLRSGRDISVRAAAGLGMIDRVCCARRANVELFAFLDRVRRAGKPRRHLWSLRLEGWVAARSQPADDVRRIVAAAARSVADGLAAERRAGKPTTLPADPRVMPFRPPPQCVGVVGSTPWAAAWAMAAAVRGAEVVTRDELSLDEPVAAWRDRLTPLEADAAAGRVRRGDRFDRADLILVACPHARLDVIEASARPRCVLAVAGRGVADAQVTADRPGRVVGLAPPLFESSSVVEVVRAATSCPAAVAALTAWVGHLRLAPLVVSDRPTQVVRRLAAAVWDEAVRLAAEGTPFDIIDRAGEAVGVGRPLAGLDGFGLAEAVGMVPRLAPLLVDGEPFYLNPRSRRPSPNQTAQALLWDARSLRAAARGRRATEAVPDEWSAAERLLLRGLAEGVRAVADDDFAGPAEIDVAAVRGAGLFARLGGPLRGIDATGLADVIRRLRQQPGRRFNPPAELVRRAAGGEPFYGATGVAGRIRAAA